MKTIPLEIPEGFPKDYPDRRSEFRQRHPVWGWLVAWFHLNKWRVLEREFAQKLSARSTSLKDEWRDYPEFWETLQALQTLFNEHLWLEDIVFLPEDPYCIIGQLVTGDLCEVEAIMAIEEEFGIEIGEDDFNPKTTMLDFVRLIESRRVKPTANKPTLASPTPPRVD